MKYLIYLFTLSFMLLSGCCKKKACCADKSKTEVKEESTSVQLTEEEKQAELMEAMKNEKIPNQTVDYQKIAEKEIPANALARIQRTACFGRCPIYTMIIFEDGRVEYYGKKFVDKIGPHYAKASLDKLKNLKEKAREFGFFEMDDIYDQEGITDLPSTITTIKGKEGFKTVVNRHEAPEALHRLEKYIEETFSELEFVTPD